MAKTKTTIGFSKKFTVEGKVIDNALQDVAGHIIAETKAANSYLVISDKDGKIKKIPAKDL